MSSILKSLLKISRILIIILEISKVYRVNSVKLNLSYLEECTFHYVQISNAAWLEAVIEENQYGQMWTIQKSESALTNSPLIGGTLINQSYPTLNFRESSICNVHLVDVTNLAVDLDQNQVEFLRQYPTTLINNGQESTFYILIASDQQQSPSQLDWLKAPIQHYNFRAFIFLVGSRSNSSNSQTLVARYWICKPCLSLGNSNSYHFSSEAKLNGREVQILEAELGSHFHGATVYSLHMLLPPKLPSTNCRNDYYLRVSKYSAQLNMWDICTAHLKAARHVISALNGTLVFSNEMPSKIPYNMYAEHVPIKGLHYNSRMTSIYFRKETQMIVLYCQEYKLTVERDSAFFRIFGPGTWLLIFISFNLTPFLPDSIKHLALYKSQIFFQVFNSNALLLRNGLVTTKLQLILSFMGGLVLSTIYETYLTSLVVRPAPPYAFQSIRELLEENHYQIAYLNSSTFPTPQKILAASFEARKLDHLLNTSFIEVTTREEMLPINSPTKPRGAYMLSQRYQESALSSVSRSNPTKACHAVKEPLDVTKQYFFFHNLLKDEMRDMLARLIEMGVGRYWDLYEIRLNRAWDAQRGRETGVRSTSTVGLADGRTIVNPISMSYSVIIIFKFCGYLFLLSVLAFLLELLYNVCQKYGFRNCCCCSYRSSRTTHM